MNETGIIVFGFRRREALWNVLESLRRQGFLANTHVWLDGHAHRHELQEDVTACRELANSFVDAQWRIHNGHLGIEKMMLDGLAFMARNYENIIVLEDDCFPTANAIREFELTLRAVSTDPTVFSVYGNPFRVDSEGARFSRFQGWGWATTRTKLLPVLSQLKSMFSMSEADYLSWVNEALDLQVIERLDVTPGRNVTDVLRQQFSWDSGIALLSAVLGLEHVKTSIPVIYNCGIGENSGHFHEDSLRFRQPPFNMIGVEEVWQYYDAELPEQYRGKTFFGLDELDRKIAAHLPAGGGLMVEVGANDGINQSNSLYFERKGWKTVLIEPSPAIFARCKKNRPLADVINAACVSSSYKGETVRFIDVGLMSMVDGARGSLAEQKQWIQRGETLQELKSTELLVPARSLSSILAERNIERVDLLSLDVEGYELEVLDGLDFSKYRPALIVVEDSKGGEVTSAICGHGYEVVVVLNERNFTRDVLLRDCRQAR
ncbi:FkbM family methyltransferase [Agrobacterium sp. fls2-241-TYG-188a]|uniref:FkbM family methyltransferase n=1 Tax=Agrobacterium sp. fls2-241-TYG-188a TaxID=3040275 RepID=UPI00254F64EA|nr:FkbM family methyltransferase [Agrobacterium sp. fls2-241-TYG-188a]